MFNPKRCVPIAVRALHVFFMFVAIDFLAVRLGFPASVGVTVVITVTAVLMSDLFRRYFEFQGGADD
jgi:hypothetical protein